MLRASLTEAHELVESSIRPLIAGQSVREV
jgi:hypothetical protein